MIPGKKQMFHANGVDVSAGLNATLSDTLTGDTSSGSTLNQEYKSQVAAGAFSGSFADFMKHLSVNNIIDTGYNLTDSVRKLFAKTAGQTVTEPVVVGPPASSGADMGKWIIGVGVVVLVTWGAVKLYKHYHKAK